jgi:hypothetical protein
MSGARTAGRRPALGADCSGTRRRGARRVLRRSCMSPVAGADGRARAVGRWRASRVIRPPVVRLPGRMRLGCAPVAASWWLARLSGRSSSEEEVRRSSCEGVLVSGWQRGYAPSRPADSIPPPTPDRDAETSMRLKQRTLAPRPSLTTGGALSPRPLAGEAPTLPARRRSATPASAPRKPNSPRSRADQTGGRRQPSRHTLT